MINLHNKHFQKYLTPLIKGFIDCLAYWLWRSIQKAHWGDLGLVTMADFKSDYDVDIFTLVESLDIPSEHRIGVLTKAQGMQQSSGLPQTVINVLIGLCRQEAEDSFLELAEKLLPRWKEAGLKSLEDAVDQAVSDSELFRISKELYIGKITDLLRKTL